MRQTYSFQHYRLDPPSWPTIPVLQPIDNQCKSILEAIEDDELLIECDYCGEMCEPHQLTKGKIGCSNCDSRRGRRED